MSCSSSGTITSEISTLAPESSSLPNLDASPNPTTSILPLPASQLSTYISQTLLSGPSSSITPTSSQAPTPQLTPWFSSTRRWLIIGFSILLGVAVLVGAVVTLVRKRYTTRRQKERISPTSPTPTQKYFQTNLIPEGIDTRGEEVATTGKPFSTKAEFDDVKVSEKIHRVKSPVLEAWKKGVVPSLDGQDKDADSGIQ